MNVYRTIRSLCWSRQSNLLLTSYGTKMLKFWNVYNNGILNSAVKLRYSIFDAAWIIDQEIKDEGWLFTAVADSANKINVSQVKYFKYLKYQKK